MRNGLMIAAGFAALLVSGPPAKAQTVPDAPQPQKKAPAKTPAETSPPAAAPPAAVPPAPAKDENAFPEAVSKAAEANAHSTPDAAPDDAAPQSKSPTSDANPFPEDVSRSAAKGPDQQSPSSDKTALPAGVSSSQSQGSVEEVPAIDPGRAAKDTEVGSYYLKTNDYQGALLRFRDATTADPTNVDAIFGLAETERALGKTAEAAQEYQLYLAIVPDGPKAKEARKTLRLLPPAPSPK